MHDRHDNKRVIKYCSTTHYHPRPALIYLKKTSPYMPLQGFAPTVPISFGVVDIILLRPSLFFCSLGMVTDLQDFNLSVNDNIKLVPTTICFFYRNDNYNDNCAQQITERIV